MSEETTLEQSPQEAAGQSESEEKHIAFGGEIKALGGRRFRSYLHLWGDENTKDATREYFTPETKFYLEGRSELPLLFHHGLDPVIGIQPIGKIDRWGDDKTGLWVEGVLDEHRAYINNIERLMGLNVLRMSSGTTVNKKSVDGRIVEWLDVEGSFTHTPAEPRMYEHVTTLKALTALLPPKEPQAKEGETADTANSSVTVEATPTMNEIQTLKDKKSMDYSQMVGAALSAAGIQVSDEQRNALVASIQQHMQQMAGNGGMDAAAMGAEVGKALMTALKQQQEQQQANDAAKKAVEAALAGQSRVQSYTGGGNVSVSEPLKYAHLSDNELMFSYLTAKAGASWSTRLTPSEETVQVLAGRAEAALRKDKPSAINNVTVKSVLKGAVKANEIATSTASGGGDDWVGVAYSNVLWDKVRDARIYQLLVSKGMRVEEVGQGAESVVIPTEGSDPTAYTLAQSANLGADSRPPVVVTTTRIGTGSATLTPGWLGMAVAWTTPLDEDSLIRVAPQYQRQMEEKAQETIEQLLINGDTETGANANINLIDSTPSSSPVPYYIASNGTLKYALVTGSGTSRSGGTLDENDYRETVKLLPSAIRTRLERLAFVVDPDTYSASLDIAAIKTEDVRSRATLSTGTIDKLWGIDLYQSGFMGLANTAGKISNTGANNTKGRILCLYAPYIAMGWKRNVTVEMQRLALEQATVIVVTLRLGFLMRGAGAATVSYNLTV